MGSVRRVIHKSGKKVWQARWRDPAGEQRSRNFNHKVEASRYLTSVEGRKLVGEYVDPRLSRARFGQWAKKVEAGWVNRRPSTRARDQSVMQSLILPEFGNVPVGAIRPVDVQQWVAELSSEGYAPTTVRKAYELVARVFDDAVLSGLLTHSPCLGIKLPRVERTEMRFLSPDEITGLANTIDGRFSPLVLTAAYTGCRFGELTALDLTNYEPLRRTIRIERTASEVRGKVRIGEPKTKAARRSISIPPWLVEVISSHIATSASRDSGLVFTAPEGGFLHRSSFRIRYWLPAVDASVERPMRFHDLRHSHVAMLIKQGTHPAVIAARLGHSSVRTVLDVYGHLYEGLDRDAADGLAAPPQASDVDAMWTRAGSAVVELRPKRPETPV